MFVLGGAYCSPELRDDAVPAQSFEGIASHLQNAERILVLGGFTGDLLRAVDLSTHKFTIVEPGCFAESASDLWSHAAEVLSYEEIGGLAGLPNTWYDLVMLPGGTLFTGGPWLDEDLNWSDNRALWLNSIGALCAGPRSLIADTCAHESVPSSVVLYRAVDQNGQAIVEGSLASSRSVCTLLLKESNFDSVGLLTGTRCRAVRWHSIGNVNAQLIDDHWSLLNVEEDSLSIMPGSEFQ